ncbi:MAG: response regulator, partial [Spirochaetes bacterium]|nr:response regulator [Spirochaetota bacterium]
LLESIGYEINCVSNGNAAIELYKNALKQKNPYILVIIDLSIPGGMGGEETIKWIRKMDSNAKAIVFSAYSNSPIISDYKKFGFNGIITKPFKIEDFSDVITKIISEKSIKK